MGRLRQSDLEAALDFLREAEAVDGPNAFPSALLDRFRDLVGSEGAGFIELDRMRQRLLFADGCARWYELEDVPPNAGEVFWRLRHQHPVCSWQDRTCRFEARKLSDFLTRRQLHRLEIYADYFQPMEIEYEICVGLPAPLSHTKCFLFDSGSRDFSERDCLLVDLLRPHLVHLYENAKMRRLASSLAAGADAPGELVVLDGRGSIGFATARARVLLAAYADGGGTRLPELLEDWLWHEHTRLNGDSLPPAGKPLTIERGAHRLVVRRLRDEPQTLLLTEEAVPGDGVELLTPREREILGLVDEGKTNAEIATELWISPTTVRTHLENVYAKLKVGSRTAALARVRPLTVRGEHG
ncbi:MAG TPA: LuxR C-terminal-related transcriptional regulator [Gaiellaceae bacterium]|nr:LuxR C-terminal-related transcriptional regulator [Gaiellaceae bacterium]